MIEKPRHLKRVAAKRIHATRFRLLLLCMSLSQNRCALLGDMQLFLCMSLSQNGCALLGDMHYSPKDSKKSFMREKKPLDCGLLSLEDSCSNSSRSSRWRFERFCGVSTAT